MSPQARQQPTKKVEEGDIDQLKSEELLFRSDLKPSLSPPPFPDHLRKKVPALQLLHLPPPFPKALKLVPPPFPQHLLKKELGSKPVPPPFPKHLSIGLIAANVSYPLSKPGLTDHTQTPASAEFSGLIRRKRRLAS